MGRGLKSRKFFTVPGAILVSLACSGASAETQGLPLADMIRETKVALLRVQEKAEARNLPPLSSAILELNTIQQVDASGSVKFLVIELGGGPATEAASTVKITLEPPAPGAGTDVANVQLADRLADVILASAASLAEAKKGKPPLKVTEVSVAVKFGLVRSANGGLSLAFPPFELKAGATIKASEIQTVTVSYADKSTK
jgi:Trypsin-co-occurring domain 2